MGQVESLSARRTKILLVIPTLDQSGAEKQFALLGTHLPRPQYDVSVVTLTRAGYYADPITDAGIPLVNLGKRWKFDPLAMRRLRREMDRFAPDIVHSWLFTANAYVRLVLPARRQYRIVVSERCVDVWKSGWQTWLDRRLISRTDALVGNSESVRQFYRELGLPDDKLSVVKNAVEIPEGVDRDSVRRELITRYQLPEDAFLIIYAGRLATQKRLPDLLWAIQVLRQIDPRAHLLIAGEGPLRANLELKAERLECARHVRFLGHQPDVPQLLKAADCFWLASEFEGMSNSLLEAMACGVPVLASDIAANRELVTHDQTGYLIKLGDGVGFAKFTQRLMQNPELVTRLSAAAQQMIATQHSLAQMLSGYETLYQRLLERS